LAALARLELSDAEKTGLQKDISNILEYVGQVSAVSIAGDSAPTVPANQPHNVLREDRPRDLADTMAGKEVQVKAAFPKREPARPDGGGEYNVVRKIIQKDE